MLGTTQVLSAQVRILVSATEARQHQWEATIPKLATREELNEILAVLKDFERRRFKK